MSAHIFIDNSNVIGGARRAAKAHEPTIPWPAIRVEYSHLFALLEQGLTVKTRVLAGSVPPGNEALWDHARKAKYNVDLLKKVDSDAGIPIEQGVDELLHLKIANVLLDFRPPQTLVIVTGDGSSGDYGTSFLEYVKRAAELKWDVVVWSWAGQLSRKYQKLVREGVHLVVRGFDSKYQSLTFVKPGKYTLDGGPIQIVKSRRALPL